MNWTYLRAAIKSRGYTVGQFAKVVGVDDTTIYSWTCGRSVPSLPAMMTLAEVLGIRLDMLIYACPRLTARRMTVSPSKLRAIKPQQRKHN